MKNPSTMKQISLAVSCALALGLMSNLARSQSPPDKSGYLVDQRGEVAKSGTGLCWHTGYWTPALAIAECDPDLVPRLAAADSAPAKPAAAAAPKPTPVPAASKVTLDADALFDFDKAVLRPEGKASLDAFLEKMKAITPEVIIAVGHADRLGSTEYNQALSERRASTVNNYLQGKGIPANRIHTEGKGESQPATKAEDCKGPKSAKLIACLQPDRRVVIEVVGTRMEK